MKSQEYITMHRVEKVHWWYQGLRDFLATALHRFRDHIPEHPAVLDAGCGTGANLEFLKAHLKPSYLAGFDFSDEALEFAKETVQVDELYQSDIRSPEVTRESLDLIISMDVLCITGTEATLAGLRQLTSRLKPGGLMIINVPAYQWLMAEHDVAVHTSERFTRSKLKFIMDKIGLEPALITYRCASLLPLVILARLPGMIRKVPLEVAESDLTVPPGWLNRLLLAVLRSENWLVKRGFSLPFGSSVAMVGIKKISTDD